MKKRVAPEGGFRTKDEQKVPQEIARLFKEAPGDLVSKLENFPKYIRRQKATRFIALYEIFKRILPVKGSIIECGVYQGFGLMTWANLSAVLEPNNLTRRIYGFDTFEGFKETRGKDKSNESACVRASDSGMKGLAKSRDLSVPIRSSTRQLTRSESASTAR